MLPMLCSLAGRLPAIGDKLQRQFSAVGLHKTMPSNISKHSQMQAVHKTSRPLDDIQPLVISSFVFLQTKKGEHVRQISLSFAASGFAEAYSTVDIDRFPRKNYGLSIFRMCPTWER